MSQKVNKRLKADFVDGLEITLEQVPQLDTQPQCESVGCATETVSHHGQVTAPALN